MAVDYRGQPITDQTAFTTTGIMNRKPARVKPPKIPAIKEPEPKVVQKNLPDERIPQIDLNLTVTATRELQNDNPSENHEFTSHQNESSSSEIEIFVEEDFHEIPEYVDPLSSDSTGISIDELEEDFLFINDVI